MEEKTDPTATENEPTTIKATHTKEISTHASAALAWLADAESILDNARSAFSRTSAVSHSISRYARGLLKCKIVAPSLPMFRSRLHDAWRRVLEGLLNRLNTEYTPDRPEAARVEQLLTLVTDLVQAVVDTRRASTEIARVLKAEATRRALSNSESRAAAYAVHVARKMAAPELELQRAFAGLTVAHLRLSTSDREAA